MVKQISWIEANVNDAAIAELVTRLSKERKTIEAGGCGCGCGDAGDDPAIKVRASQA